MTTTRARIEKTWDSFHSRFCFELRGLTGADSILNGTVLAFTLVDCSAALAEINSRRFWLGLPEITVS